jgi:hypothetical protein
MRGPLDSAMPILQVVSTPQEIHDNPANNSPSKALFGFPRAARFLPSKLNSSCNETFYDTQDSFVMKNKGYSMPRGKRHSITRFDHKFIPGPNAYNPIIETIGCNRGKGISFGVSREKISQLSINPHLKEIGEMPGPGSYTPTLPKSTRTIGFRIRTKSRGSENDENLGPGRYDIFSTFDPNRSIFNSKYHNVKGVVIPRLKTNQGQTFFQSRPNKEGLQLTEKPFREINPSPQRQDFNSLCGSGYQVNSKYSHSRYTTFAKSNRKTQFEKSIAPGPGTYKIPSDFGIYQSSRQSDRN